MEGISQTKIILTLLVYSLLCKFAFNSPHVGYMFNSFGIGEQHIGRIPDKKANVKYGYMVVDFTNHQLKHKDVLKTAFEWANINSDLFANKTAAFVMIMIDIDFKTPDENHYCHFISLFHNNPKNTNNKPSSILVYKGPNLDNKEAHRYVYLIYNPQSPSTLKPVIDRSKYKTVLYAQECKLGFPIAGNVLVFPKKTGEYLTILPPVGKTIMPNSDNADSLNAYNLITSKIVTLTCFYTILYHHYTH